MTNCFERTPGNDSTLPDRLRDGSGTALEQRVLNAASREQPSRELFERMALGIGVSPAPLPPIESVGPNLGTVAPKAVAGSRTLLPWLSVGAVVAVAGTLIATHSSPTTPSSVKPSASAARPSAAAALPAVASALAEQPPAPQAPSSTASTPSAPRGRASSPVADIQDQITLVDAARTALSNGASNRALELLRQYQTKYAAGSFRPEAAALKIEALAKLGRTREARTLAERFISEHRGSPLADRVARVTGAAP